MLFGGIRMIIGSILLFIIFFLGEAGATAPTAIPTAEFYAPSTPAPKKNAPTAIPTAEFYAPSTPAPKKNTPTATPTTEFYAPSTPVPKKDIPTPTPSKAIIAPLIREKEIYNKHTLTEMEIGYYVLSAIVSVILLGYFCKWYKRYWDYWSLDTMEASV